MKVPAAALLPLLIAAAFLPISAAQTTRPRQVGEICGGAGASCAAGLQCQLCTASGDARTRCAQIVPVDPKGKGTRLPFNRYAWLTTHNSFAQANRRSATGSAIIAPTNQDDTVADQLKNGVRGLMLDFYDFLGDIWLCHSFGGNCYNVTAFEPAINVLKEIQAFLAANPTEIVTIFIEDYVKTPQGLTKLFDAAGLRQYWFPVTKMPANGGNWPLVSDMIRLNQRLIVFTSKAAKQASEGIAYVWNYVVENQYGDGGMKAGFCPSRAESSPMNTNSKSLVLLNYFPDNPDSATACKDHSASLMDMLTTCKKSSGNRWANFVAVDFYKRSNGGGAPLAVDTANGHLVCGCDNVAFCKVNGTFGKCDVPTSMPAASPGESAPGMPNGAPDGSSSKRTPSTPSSSCCKMTVGRRLLQVAAMAAGMSLLS